MIDNKELPIGFTMELAQNSEILKRFSDLQKSEQDSIINGARNIKSRNEMHDYVKSLFK